ncbi:MAG TPA: FoF1 ATP synthase subunit gamma [Coriobacteriia bacterium]|nr:FoF1 ATP synthase subunit gamma [Coriobacteriia bacterium]
MQKLHDIRRRISTVEGIGDVCRTMSTVAAARLAMVRERALGVRAHAAVLKAMAMRQQHAAPAAGLDVVSLSPLMEVRQPQRVLTVVVGADRGLCGGYNLALGRAAVASLKRFAATYSEPVRCIALGDRAVRFLTIHGIKPEVPWHWTRAGVTVELVTNVLDECVRAFLLGEADEVWAQYTSFISAVQREPALVRLLPIALDEADSPADDVDARWFYEPDVHACVDELLAVLVRLQVEDVLLESYASEQAARMVTMEEAAERADRSLGDLRVRYNRVRREAITADLTSVLVSRRVRQVGKS